MCKQQITDRNWEPFCCEVCFDSHDAMFQREIESGYIDHLFARDE